MYREANKTDDYREANLDQEIETQASARLDYQPAPGLYHGDADDLDTDAPPAAKPERRRVSLWPIFDRRALIGFAAVIALAALAIFGLHWWISGRYVVTTDDAYVGAHNTTLASKISGYVASIPTEDNAQIRSGEVIATIDDGDYRLAVDGARQKAATQQATVDRIGRQIAAQAAMIDQAKAQMVSAQAGAKKSELEYQRQKTLAAQTYASQQQLEQARGQSRSGRRRGAKRASRHRFGCRHARRAQSPATGGRPHARRIADRAGQSRARSFLHRHSRAGRRRVLQPRGADRRLRADRPAASRASCR
jgi:multidrug efflux pump subunit AcrA (membrane-fusion protein)